MNFAEIRPATSMLLDLIEAGIVDPVEVVKAALMWLEDRNVKRMAEVNEFFPYPMDEEDE